MTINFNVAPYYDDFEDDKNFHRILFKPAVAVQARELTQLQSILQRQVERFGRHIFKEGAMVIPGQVSLDLEIGYVKLAGPPINTDSLQDLVGRSIYGGTSTVSAKIIAVADSAGTDPNTLIVKYISSGTTTGETKTFSAGEILYYDELRSTSIGTIFSGVAPVGKSSVAQIDTGIYFVKGVFVRVESQTIILDKYSNAPSYRIGLVVDEQLVTAVDDGTLLDNAQGTFNFAAPGADRYKIVATLGKLPLDSILDQDFIELMRVEDGTLISQVRVTEYSELEKTLARRTYDESGDYTVVPFKLQQREYRNNDREGWFPSIFYVRNDIVSYEGNTYVCLTDHTAASSFSTDLAGTRWVLDNDPPYNRGLYKVTELPNATFGANLLAMGLEPGKAYVRGFEIEKISTQYLTIPKARDFATADEDLISTQVGNFILVTNLTNDFEVTNFKKIELRDQLTSSRGVAAGAIVGSARVRYIEFHSGTIGQTTAVYKVSLFDVQMVDGKSFDKDVKQLFIENGANDSSADVIFTQVAPLRGTISVSGSGLTGVGTAFLQQLRVGDYILASSNATPMRIEEITSDLAATVSPTNLTGITGASYGIILAPFQEVAGEPLVFKLPQEAIKSVTTSEVTARVLKKYENSPATGSLTITDSTVNFESSNASDYIVINKITGNVVPGITVTINSATQITLASASFVNGNNHAIYAKVIKRGTAPFTVKSKTLTVGSITFTAEQAAAAELSLGKADVFKIDSIICNGQEIKEQYILDDGQRPTHYGISKIIRDSVYYPPGAAITVSFRYFVHANTGDCFTVGSYDVRYEDIPSFSYNGESVRLSDVLDFRPRINDIGTEFSSGTGASLSSVPVRDRATQLDYDYFLPRHDKIALDSSGQFFTITGVPALEPKDPDDPSNSMVLYKLEIAPYTKRENDMYVRYIDNKRYTMRDIGRLEKRIDNIEYYTALSLLEQETKTFSILDSDGFDRFKAGFVVDNFSGHQVGDVTQPDYLCSIDMEQNTLRPFFRLDNFNLNAVSNTNIRVTGDLATLPYTDVDFIEQPYASMQMNVNPYNVFTFRGIMYIHPTQDEWFEVEQLPDIIINDNSIFDSLVRGWTQQGVLGTVWNSWQTVWSGTPVVTGTRTTTEYQNASGWPRRDIRTTTFAQQIGESRTGVTTSYITRTEQRNLGSRVLYTAVVPFIRARPVAFVARGLKPNTRYYPFFDGTNVSSFIKPATRLTIGSGGLNFDKETNAGLAASEAAPRRINNNPAVALNRGDVVVNSTNSGVTYGVVIHRDGTSLYVVNELSNTYVSNTIIGSISGATATVTAATVSNLGNAIVTSSLGDAAGLFFLPNTSAIRFRTGTREFKLTESVDNIDRGNSRARARYTASGILETRQQTIAQVRIPELVTTDLVENRTRTINSQQVNVGEWYDPLAQTFLVEQEGGAFLTKLDLFFATKDPTVPVTVEIREVVNGYPGKTVLPFSRVVKGAEEVVTSPTATVATTFTFQSPVYVESGGEYAIVILSDSDNYNVWIAEIGQITVGEDRLISEQPYLGSLFKSQNASTWTADQTQDLKFKLYRASFSPLSGTMTFNNERLAIRPLDANPFLTTNTTATVRVTHLNHDLKNGANVTFFGAQGFDGSNITLAQINKTHTVSNVLIDSYTITAANVAATTGVRGAGSVFASKNMAFDAIQPVVEYISFPQTTLDFRVRTTDYSTWSLSSFPGTPVIANDTNFFNRPQVVLSSDNDADGVNKSFEMIAFFGSTRENLSPVIDLNRLSVTTVKNKINNPLRGDYALGGFNIGGPVDTRTIATSNVRIGFANSTIYSTSLPIANIFSTVSPGREIRITNAANPTNNANVIVSSVDKVTGNITVDGYTFTTEAPGAAITIITREGYVDEIAPTGGSAISKYMTRQIDLRSPATFIKVLFSAAIPPDKELELYYKILPVGSYAKLSDLRYYRANPSRPAVKTADTLLFTDVEYDITAPEEFSSLVIKLVFRGSPAASSFVPQVRDLRVIACA